MKIFFGKSLKEIQKEKEDTNYQEKIQQLQQENASLREELELTQEAVNDLLFGEEGGE